MADVTPDLRRFRRCFHRVISGLERGGSLRLITLTSSDTAQNPIQQDWRRLTMRLQRRNLLKDYIRVVEVNEDGRTHIHAVIRGSYIEQAYISALWEQIHQSPVVDIRAVKKHKGSKRGVANYLAKYMAKEGHRRYSWSWNWVYKGFVRTWKHAISLVYRMEVYHRSTVPFTQFLKFWRSHLRTHSPPNNFLSFLYFQLSLSHRVWMEASATR